MASTQIQICRSQLKHVRLLRFGGKHQKSAGTNIHRTVAILYAVCSDRVDSLSIILPVPKDNTSFCFLRRDQCYSSYCILHWL